MTQNPVFISGVARSGTTLLGRLIGTLNNIEYEFEPLYLLQIPVLVKFGCLQPEIAAQLLANNMHENLVELVLGRKVNLRPGDWSRFWSMKPYENLVLRWDRSDARQDVRRVVEEQGLRFAGKSHSLTPFYPFLLEHFPECQIINITRNGFDVVASALKRDWYSDMGLVRQRDRIRVPKREEPDGRRIPWWVPEDLRREFLDDWNHPTRVLYMWRSLVEAGLEVDDPRILDIRFEDLFRTPSAVLERILGFLEGSKTTLKTDEVLQTIDPSRAKGSAVNRCWFSEELALANDLMERLGYT